MNHIWRYLQTEENKNVVVICQHGDQAEIIIKDIADKVKRHSILNSKKLKGFTRNVLAYDTNKVLVFQFGVIEWRLRGYSIDLFLLHEDLDHFQKMKALNIAAPAMTADCIMGKYKDESDYHYI